MSISDVVQRNISDHYVASLIYAVKLSNLPVNNIANLDLFLAFSLAIRNWDTEWLLNCVHFVFNTNERTS